MTNACDNSSDSTPQPQDSELFEDEMRRTPEPKKSTSLITEKEIEQESVKEREKVLLRTITDTNACNTCSPAECQPFSFFIFTVEAEILQSAGGDRDHSHFV